MAYRIALRDDSHGDLDDVVVNRVEMFRAEMMSDTELWMCCYFPGSDERLTFNVRATRRKGRKLALEFTAVETPHGHGFTYEDGALPAVASASGGADT